MVRAEVRRLVEPEAGRLGQHLALEGDRRKDAVEGRNPVGRDQDAPAGSVAVAGRS